MSWKFFHIHPLIRKFERQLDGRVWKVFPSSNLSAELTQDISAKTHYAIEGYDSNYPAYASKVRHTFSRLSTFKHKKVDVIIILAKKISREAIMETELGKLQSLILVELYPLNEERVELKVHCSPSLREDPLLLLLTDFLQKIDLKTLMSPSWERWRREITTKPSIQAKSMDLTTIPLISEARAKVLCELGIRTIFNLLSRDPLELSSNEQVKRCDGSFSSEIPLIFKYARSKVERRILVTGVDETFMDVVNSEVYFLDLEYHPDTPIFLYGLMDAVGKVMQIFVEDPTEEKKALEDFLNVINEKKVDLGHIRLQSCRRTCSPEINPEV